RARELRQRFAELADGLCRDTGRMKGVREGIDIWFCQRTLPCYGCPLGFNSHQIRWASMDGREIIDISPLIHSGIGVFPGDTPFREAFLLSMEKGDGFTLSKIETTVHLGAHADAPSHYTA